MTGTKNLEMATSHQPLLFFLMLSSWTAQFGTATQANYLASCAFMDAFAGHRRAQGLPGTSLSLTRIRNSGVIARNPLYAESLSRNSLYGNSEEEFLRHCDTAIADEISRFSSSDVRNADLRAQNSSHLLAGIEPRGLLQLDRTYSLRETGWYNDARFTNLVNAVEILEVSRKSDTSDGNTGNHSYDKSGLDDGEASSLSALERIHKKAAQLLYIPLETLDITKSFTQYGIDSMIAAELKAWVFRGWEKISVFGLLSGGMTVQELAEIAVRVKMKDK